MAFETLSKIYSDGLIDHVKFRKSGLDYLRYGKKEDEDFLYACFLKIFRGLLKKKIIKYTRSIRFQDLEEILNEISMIILTSRLKRFDFSNQKAKVFYLYIQNFIYNIARMKIKSLCGRKNTINRYSDEMSKYDLTLEIKLDRLQNKFNPYNIEQALIDDLSFKKKLIEADNIIKSRLCNKDYLMFKYIFDTSGIEATLEKRVYASEFEVTYGIIHRIIDTVKLVLLEMFEEERIFDV